MDEDTVRPDPPGNEAAPATATSPAATPRQWRYAPDAWRLARRLDFRNVDMLFRARSARLLPASARYRFLNLGIPPEVVDETLGRIRRASEWSDRWIETAQRFLGDTRRQESAQNIREAAQAREIAAMCYHAAQIFEPNDRLTVRKCRAAAASLFTQTLPALYPNARHLWIPWRSRSLPAYFQMPEPVDEPVGLVVVLNGASMSKEETFGWGGRFLERGFAVLDLDSPGTGEATGVADATADHDDVLDGVFEVFANESIIDLDRVVVLGSSLGANQAVRAAAHDRRIMASIAVTPPYEPARWLHRASPLLHMELGLLSQGQPVEELWDTVTDFALDGIVDEARQPMLIFGAGRDVIVPPTEPQLLAERVGERATLVWYPRGGHCLYEAVDQWTFEAAVWAEAVGAASKDPELRGDPGQVSAMARSMLEAAEYTPAQRAESALDDDDFSEYARLITPDDDEQKG